MGKYLYAGTPVSRYTPVYRSSAGSKPWKYYTYAITASEFHIPFIFGFFTEKLMMQKAGLAYFFSLA